MTNAIAPAARIVSAVAPDTVHKVDLSDSVNAAIDTPWFYVEQTLGYLNVFRRIDRKELTYSQRGDFTNVAALSPTLASAVGADPQYPDARVQPSDQIDVSAWLRPGTVGIDALFLSLSQSNTLCTTGNSDGVGDPAAPITVLTSIPWRIMCFNGGYNPLGAPSGDDATIIPDPSLYDHYVNANMLVNPASGMREHFSFAAAEHFLSCVPDFVRAIIIDASVGSTNFSTDILAQPVNPFQNAMTAYVAKAAAIAAAANRTLVIVYFAVNGWEAEQSIPAIQNGVNELITLDTKVQTILKPYAIGQTAPIPLLFAIVNAPNYDINHVPPSNVNNNNPTTSQMGKISLFALAVQQFVLQNSGHCACFAQYDNPGDYVARVHHLARGHERNGVKFGELARQYWAYGSMRTLPRILSLGRVIGSKLTTATFDRAIERVGASLVIDPGAAGIIDRDIIGQNTVDATTIAAVGSVLSYRTVAEASGVDEFMDLACGNSVGYMTTLISRQGDGTWPYETFEYGLACTTGQRSQFRDAALLCYSKRTGEQMHDYVPPTQTQKRITSAQTLYYDIAADMAAHGFGTTPSFIIDPRDTASYPGSGVTFTDRVAGAVYTSSGVTVVDNGHGGGALTRRMVFNGSGNLKPNASPTFADNWHKAGAQFVVACAFVMPAFPFTPNVSQYLFANCRDTTGSGAGPGFALRLNNTAGRPGLVIRGAGGAVVFAINSLLWTPGVWQYVMFGIDALHNTGWRMTTADMAANGNQPITFAVNYASPSAAAAEGKPAIGCNGSVAVSPALVNLTAGAEMIGPEAFAYQGANYFLPYFNTMVDRLALLSA